MSKVRFEEMFPWELARAMADAPICYLPLGVLEWHGEHSAVGLDGIKAHAVCEEAARRSGGVVVPALWWGADEREDLPDGTYITGGIERGERYHVPGSIGRTSTSPWRSSTSCWQPGRRSSSAERWAWSCGTCAPCSGR